MTNPIKLSIQHYLLVLGVTAILMGSNSAQVFRAMYLAG